WANGLSKLDFLDPLLIKSAQDNIRRLKAGDSMSKEVDELNKMADRLWDRSPAPRLTPEQLNAIDLLILGKTDREVSEIVGVRRETITKWHKNPFFTAELNVKREELWRDSKLRLKSLAHEAVNILTNGLHSSDEKIAITAAVHILKTVGLYDGEWKNSIDLPKTPEEALWIQTVQGNTNVYRGVRPDSITDWTTKKWTEEVGTNLAAKVIAGEYEVAVDDQKKELREYKKKLKAQGALPQLPQIDLIPVSENGPEDASQGQESGPEPEEA
ncbi:MAG TPA: hypothetical protein PK712_09965, partial [Rectinema sp.]|nr:hypothetical protein [Rectinema sp.]